MEKRRGTWVRATKKKFVNHDVGLRNLKIIDDKLTVVSLVDSSLTRIVLIVFDYTTFALDRLGWLT